MTSKNSFKIRAVLAASGLSSFGNACLNGWPSFGAFGSVSVTLALRPSPRITSTALCSVASLNKNVTSSICRPLMISANSLVRSRIRPARRSITILLSPRVAKLHLKATSPGCKSMPTPAASIGPRPG